MREVGVNRDCLKHPGVRFYTSRCSMLFAGAVAGLP